MPRYVLILLLCLAIFNTAAQTTHSVLVKVNQAPECPIVSGLEEAENIKIFPNPVDQSTFMIQSEILNARVEIHDLKGTILWKAQLMNGRIEVNALNFKSGVYIVTIMGRKDSYQMKIQIR